MIEVPANRTLEWGVAHPSASTSERATGSIACASATGP
jgi:hypothetical protein